MGAGELSSDVGPLCRINQRSISVTAQMVEPVLSPARHRPNQGPKILRQSGRADLSGFPRALFFERVEGPRDC